MSSDPTSSSSQIRAQQALERALEAVDRHESTVHAWAHLDSGRAFDEARSVDARGGGPLAGLTLGIKDIFDTSDHPTSYGSPIYEGFRPRSDAAAVALLRAAGAVCVGKTITTEFASGAAGPTRNPHRLTHTPGGSSSGSAAAVATGMADIALGSQTLGSTIRPASFCGVWGFKPTHGLIPRSGMKPVADALDTVGWFARSVEDLDRVRVTLTGRRLRERLDEPCRLAVFVTDQSPAMSTDSERVLQQAADLASSAGAQLSEHLAPPSFDGLTERARYLMGYEAVRSFAWERREHRAEISDYLNDFLDLGETIDAAERDAILAVKRAIEDDLEATFHGADCLLYPSASGEAPEGLESTGDRRFQALWTLLGFPTLSVPGLTGSSGLPVGVQVVGRPGHDASVLAVGEWLGMTFQNQPTI